MIKTITPLCIDEGVDDTWDAFEPMVGRVSEGEDIEVNTLQAVKSKKTVVEYISKIIEKEVPSRVLWIFPSTDIEYDFEYKTVEVYITTFSNNSEITTYEPIIGVTSDYA